jgi:hypothetical protein
MCYTADKSIYAFVIGSSISLYLFNQANSDLKIIGGFFFFVSFMQLFDYIFWTTKKIETNRLTTKIACIFNHLQPIVLAYLIIKYKGNLSNNLRNLVLLRPNLTALKLLPWPTTRECIMSETRQSRKFV